MVRSTSYHSFLPLNTSRHRLKFCSSTLDHLTTSRFSWPDFYIFQCNVRFHRVILEMLLSLFYQLQILVSSQNPPSAPILIRSPSNVLSIHSTILDTVNTTSFLDHQRKTWLRHGVIHSSSNTNPMALSRSTNHLKSIEHALNQRSTRHWLAFGPT